MPTNHHGDYLFELMDFVQEFLAIRLFLVNFNFNLEASHPVTLSFMDNENLINLVKGNTCFKSKKPCFELILTTSRRSFKYSFFTKTVLSDYHYLISSMIKRTFGKKSINIPITQN